jgi:hypothetical protein
MDRPTSQSNQRACDTNKWCAVEEGKRGAALAVSGQTRIQWESSARGALRFDFKRRYRIARVGEGFAGGIPPGTFGGKV